MNMTEQQARDCLITAMITRKVTAIVIAESWRHVDHVFFPQFIEALRPKLSKVRRSEAIEIMNGSHVIFVTPNGLYHRLAGLAIDVLWVATPLTPNDWLFVRSRTLVAAAVVLESA